MDKNLKNQPGLNRPASDSTPGGMKTMDPKPGGGMVKNISGPSIHNKSGAGDKKNDNGIDGGTSVISS